LLVIIKNLVVIEVGYGKTCGKAYFLLMRRKYLISLSVYVSVDVGLSEELCMPVAFVLINAEIGSEGEVLGELKKIEGVKEAYFVYGVYDVIAKVEADSMDKLKELITWRIRRITKVRSTLTMIVIEAMT